MKKKQSIKNCDKNKIEHKEKIRCPMQKLLNLLSGPWTTYILWLLCSQGPQRFGEFRKSIPQISSKMLTQRLRMLEDEGIVDREQTDTIPPQVTYSLNRRGKQLDDMLDEINKLAQKWYNC